MVDPLQQLQQPWFHACEVVLPVETKSVTWTRYDGIFHVVMHWASMNEDRIF